MASNQWKEELGINERAIISWINYHLKMIPGNERVSVQYFTLRAGGVGGVGGKGN
jgi:hypothetical protein